MRRVLEPPRAREISKVFVLWNGIMSQAHDKDQQISGVGKLRL